MRTTLIIILLSMSIKIFSQSDSTKVDYIQLLQIDTTQYNPEAFFDGLWVRYSVFGEIVEMNCVLGKNDFDIETICIRFADNPIRWFVYTPIEIERKLKEKKQ